MGKTICKFIFRNLYHYINLYCIFSEPSAGGAYFDDLAIDEVVVGESVTCPEPSSLTASNVSSNSADLTWIAGGSETSWSVMYDDGSNMTTMVSTDTN